MTDGFSIGVSMKICEICGNEIEDDVTKCPFCKSHVAGSASRGKKGAQGLVTVNLKSDLPTTVEAVRRLGVKLGAARRSGARVVRVIHGWGSTGSGGKIKQATHTYLGRQEHQGRIKAFVPGEAYSGRSGRGRNLLAACPLLKRSLRTDKGNRGITLVEL
jgi:hypothetical protein